MFNRGWGKWNWFIRNQNLNRLLSLLKIKGKNKTSGASFTGWTSWQITLSSSFPMLIITQLRTLQETYSRSEMPLEDLFPGKEVIFRYNFQINPSIVSLTEGDLGSWSVWKLTQSWVLNLLFWTQGSKVKFTWDLSACQQGSFVLNYPSGIWTCTLFTYPEGGIQIFPDPLPEMITAISYKNAVLNTGCD